MTPTRRENYERAQRRKAAIIATISTLVVVAAIVLLVPLAPGWEAVQRSFFNGTVFAKTFPKLLVAFWLDVKIFLWSLPLIVITALAIAVSRNLRSPALFPLRLFGALYTDVLRGVPTILLVYITGFGIPGLGLPRPWNSPYIWGTLALVLVYSAYMAEVFRAGIESVHESQRAASRSLGFGEGQTLRHVVLPQAIRSQVPSIMNLVVALQKDVALLSFIGPVEVLRQANVFKSLMANFTPYVGAAVIFLTLTIPMTRLADYLAQRQRRAQGGTFTR